jgi:hypothetical protein
MICKTPGRINVQVWISSIGSLIVFGNISVRHLCEVIRNDADCLILLDCSVRSLPPWAMVLLLLTGLGLACDVRLAPPSIIMLIIRLSLNVIGFLGGDSLIADIITATWPNWFLSARFWRRGARYHQSVGTLPKGYDQGLGTFVSLAAGLMSTNGSMRHGIWMLG